MKISIFYIILTGLLIFNELSAHDISLATCYSQSVTQQNSFRLSVVRGSWEFYRFEMASANLIEDNSINGKYYISTNTISLLLNYISKNTEYEDIFNYILIPQIIGNMKFGVDVYSEYLWIIFGQTTDYYIHYKVARIFTASSVGIEAQAAKFRFAAELQIPLSKGYRKDKSPYLQLLIGYYL